LRISVTIFGSLAPDVQTNVNVEAVVRSDGRLFYATERNVSYTKVRSDFVTNSSSSSFILAFKDEASVYSTLKNQFPEDIEEGWSAGEHGYFYQVLEEINEAPRLTKEDLEQIILDEHWSAKWELERKYMDEHGATYREFSDYLETDEGIQALERAYSSYRDSILAAIGDNKVIVEIEHGDGGEGEDGMLEHHILPYLDCVKVRFSHH
jgi:hypothetical protein